MSQANETHGSFGRKVDSFEGQAVHGNLNASGEPVLTFEKRLAAISPIAIDEYTAAKKSGRAYRVAVDAHYAEQQELRADVQKAGLHLNAAQSDPSSKARDLKRLEAALATAQTLLKNCVLEAKPSRLQLYEEFKREFVQRKYAPANTADSWPGDATSDREALDWRTTEFQKNRARVMSLEAESVSRDDQEAAIDAAVEGLRTGAPVLISEKDGRVVWPIRMESVGTISRDTIDVAAVLADLLGDQLKAALKARITTPLGGGLQRSERAARMAELTAESDSICYRIAFWIRKIEAAGGTVDVRWPMKPEHYLDLKRLR